MTHVRALAATGALGTGYRSDSLARAMEMQPDFIGCDAGSTDPGPFYLGSGRSLASPAAIERDLKHMIRAGVVAGIPVLIGSAGTGGGRPHLEKTLDIVRSLASEIGIHFRMASIDAELDKSVVAQALLDHRLRPLAGAPQLDSNVIDNTTRIVAQMGAEPFQKAIAAGAEVVVAGRASDAAIFAAIPMMRGCGAGPSWHAAKILECGAASVAQRRYPDCMMADIRDDDFTVYAPNPELACTPQSIAAHTLYENADPYFITEPSGVLDTTQSKYIESDHGSVRVTGSTFETKPQYDVKLEAVAFQGHRFLVPAGIRDPIILRNIDRFLEESTAIFHEKVAESLELIAEEDYQCFFRVYGRDACLGLREPLSSDLVHEVGLHMDIVTRTIEAGQAIAAIAWHTLLHHPVPEWSGLISNLAFPYSPPEVYVGPVYEFVINHVMDVDDPIIMFPMQIEDV